MTATLAIARLTLVRLVRGRALWLALVIAALPLVFVNLASPGHRRDDAAFTIELVIMVVLQPMLVASSIADEIEDRTATYLWSRPLPRWSVLLGKLLALAPIGAALIVGGWLATWPFGMRLDHPEQTVLGLGAGALAAAAIATGVATVVPKHGMALAIAYLGTDWVIGTIPWSLRVLSATHQTAILGGQRDDATVVSAAIAIAVITGAWLAIGLWRVRRLET